MLRATWGCFGRSMLSDCKPIQRTRATSYAIEWGYTDEGYIPIDTYRIETCDELEFMFLAGMAAVTKKVEV